MSVPTRSGALAGLLALVWATGAGADERKDAFGDPLPEGAKARLGTVRGGPTGYYATALLAPKYDTFLFADNTGLHLHDAATGKVTNVGAEGRPGGTRAIVAVSADGTRAVADQFGSYEVIDVAAGKPLQTIRSGNIGYRSAVSLSADGKLFAYDGRTRGAKDAKNEVVVWDVDKNEQVARVTVLQNESASAILSPDGKALATYGMHFDRNPVPNPNPPAPDAVIPARTVQVWDVATGKQLAALSDATTLYGNVTAALFAPDGKTLVTSSPGALSLWEVPSGKHKETLLCRATQGQKLAFAPDGKTLAAVDQYGAVERWALPDAKPLKLTEFPAALFRAPPSRYVRTGIQPTGIGFADNERVVVWGLLFGRAVAWEAPSGKMITPVAGHVSEILSVRFASNGREMVSTARDARVVRWDIATGKPALAPAFPTDDEYVPTGDARLALGPGGARTLRGPLVYDLEAGAELFRLPATHVFPSEDFTHALGVLPARDRNAPAAACAIWNLETRKKVASLELPGRVDAFGARGVAAAFSPDNSRLVTAMVTRDPAVGQDNFVVTGWEVKTGKKLGEFGEPRGLHMTEIAVAGNNSGAVLATSDGKLWVADFEKGTRADTIDEAQPGRGGRITCPTFSPDGKLLAAGVPTEKAGEFAVRVYDWPSGRMLRTFTGHRGPISALAFAADGKALASGSADSTVLVWDLTKIDAK